MAKVKRNKVQKDILNKEIYSTKDLADLLGIDPKNIRYYAEKGRIQGEIGLRNKRTFTKEAVIQFLRAEDLLIEDITEVKDEENRVDYKTTIEKINNGVIENQNRVNGKTLDVKINNMEIGDKGEDLDNQKDILSDTSNKDNISDVSIPTEDVGGNNNLSPREQNNIIVTNNTLEDVEVNAKLNLKKQDSISTKDVGGNNNLSTKRKSKKVVSKEEGAVIDKVKKKSRLNKIAEKSPQSKEIKHKRDVIYARVSNEVDSNNLDNQVEMILEQIDDLQEPLVLKEIGSGYDDKRKYLRVLMEAVLEDKVNRVYITSKDRLSRLGYNYLEMVLELKNVQIIVVTANIHVI